MKFPSLPHGFTKLFPTRFRRWVPAFLIGIVVIALAGFAVLHFHPSFPDIATMGPHPEVQELSAARFSFQEYETYFRTLSEKKGALYAFDVLRKASFPPGVDLHLIAHVVGDMLYKEKGISAMKYCTDEFRNACSHSVVIAILQQHGEGSLPQIAEQCKQAPGGKGAYTMCFHGLGHGVLAYTGYDLEKAVAMCKKVGTAEYHDREYVECVGGTIMEMIAGVHDPVAWAKQKDNYFKTSDPLYPCTASFIPDEAKGMCITYLTPHLFTSAGMNLGDPDPTLFGKAFSYCKPLTDKQLRATCFAGFGKEFTVIAAGKDIRNVGQLPTDRLAKVREWCASAKDPAGESACDGAALSSLFWGGENEPTASLAFCALAPEGPLAQDCYFQLADQIRYYSANAAKAASVCALLPEKYRARCSP